MPTELTGKDLGIDGKKARTISFWVNAEGIGKSDSGFMDTVVCLTRMVRISTGPLGELTTQTSLDSRVSIGDGVGGFLTELLYSPPVGSTSLISMTETT